MPQSPLGPYQIDAFNTAKDSENKIHDDAVARRFWFSRAAWCRGSRSTPI